MLDIPSYLLGRKSVKPTPPEPQKTLPPVTKSGYFGDGNATAATSITVSATRFGYLLVSVMHRDTLTAPSGFTLLDKTTYTTGAGTQYVSVFKSDDRIYPGNDYTFTQASSARISATAWVILYDFTLTKLDTVTGDLFTYNVTYETADFGFFTMSSYGSTGSTTAQVAAECNSAWVNEPVTFNNAQLALRHYSGIFYPTNVPRPITVREIANTSDSFSVSGQVVYYKIVKA